MGIDSDVAVGLGLVTVSFLSVLGLLQPKNVSNVKKYKQRIAKRLGFFFSKDTIFCRVLYVLLPVQKSKLLI